MGNVVGYLVGILALACFNLGSQCFLERRIPCCVDENESKDGAGDIDVGEKYFIQCLEKLMYVKVGTG